MQTCYTKGNILKDGKYFFRHISVFGLRRIIKYKHNYISAYNLYQVTTKGKTVKD